MKEIGERLREAREAMGISVEEAAEDLKIRPAQLENIEDGNKEAFKDVFYLKFFIRDYAKYLGLDGEKIMDEFNEYLFDFTSKIPVGEIEKAKENKNNKKKVVSPYTKMSEKSNNIKMLILSIIIVLVIIVVGYLVVSEIHKNDFKDNNTTYVIRR